MTLASPLAARGSVPPLPLDPELPEARRAFMAADAGAAVVLDDDESLVEVDPSPDGDRAGLGVPHRVADGLSDDAVEIRGQRRSDRTARARRQD